MTASILDSMWKIMSCNTLTIISETCNYNCDICHKVIINAYIANCGCQFCKSCLDKYLADGYKCCPAANSHSPSLINVSEVLPDNGANIKISRLKVRCIYAACECIVDLSGLDEHLRVCEHRSVECPYSKIDCDGRGDGNDNLALHLHSDSVKHSNLLMDTIGLLKNEIIIAKEESRQREIETKTQSNVINELINQKNETQEVIVDLERQLNAVKKNAEEEMDKRIKEMIIFKNVFTITFRDINDKWENQCFGGILWKINDMPKKIRIAKKGTKQFWYSNSFYSHPGGYKLRLHLFPNGYLDGEGSHLCVGFQLLKNPNDNDLEWPFNGTVMICLVDQRTFEDRCVRTYNYLSVPEERQYIFNKPVHRFSHGFGDNKVIAISDLINDHGLLSDKAIIVKCTIIQ